jgi:serine-type D-Ala-D-Ala carboxypeptidase/endopeptidase
MKIFKRIFLIFFIPFFSFAMTSEEIEKVMKVCVDGGHTQGMVIAVIKEDGTKFYKYGKMAVDDPTPMDENAIFETGSVTKIFTSLLLEEMASRGEVALNDPMEKYLPPGTRVPDYKGKKITLEHLSTHTAGFPYIPVNFFMKDMYNPFCEYSLQFLYDFFASYKLPFEPGSQYIYSNVSIGTLGYVLSLRAGKDYETLVYERILKPLGMESTKVNLNQEMQKRFAKAHIRSKIVAHWDIAVFDGAGGLHSTAKDLARFIEANLGFYKTDLFPILKAAYQARCKQDIPNLDVGHEWNISYQYKPEIIYHGGATGGHQIFIGFCPENKIGVVVCSNSAAYIYDIGKNILNKEWYLKNYRQQIITTPMMLYKFDGEYKNIDDGSVCKIIMNDQGYLSFLMLEWGYYPASAIYSSTEKDFFMKVRPIEIHFDLNKQNEQKVDFMTIEYAGISYKFKKI